jgi:hypothetical protein
MFTLLWLIQLALGKIEDHDRERLRYGLGLWSPSMRPHWHRLVSDPSGHTWVNIWTEWCRLDAQRAGKVYFDLSTLTFLIGYLAATRL